MARHERRTPTRSWCLSFGRQFRSRASSPSLRASGCVSSTSTGRSVQAHAAPRSHAIVCLLRQPCDEAHRRTTADQSLSVTPYDSLSCPRCSEHNRGHVTLHSFFCGICCVQVLEKPVTHAHVQGSCLQVQVRQRPLGIAQPALR